MNYIRNFGDLLVGQRVLQVAFGSGFKCNSAVWLCINNSVNRPGRRTKISDRELESEALSKELDEEGYIKRRAKTLSGGCMPSSSSSAANNTESSKAPRLTEEELKKLK